MVSRIRFERDRRHGPVRLAGLVTSILIAALYAAAYFSQTLDEQYRYGSDNYQVLASIVADHNPGYFDADSVLNDPNNYRFYRTAFTTLVDWVYQWLGNPGQVYGVLGIAFNAVRVFGFFLLGLRLFRSPGWALGLSVAEALEVRFDVFGEWWGIPFAIHARTAYESVFPYLLLGAITARGDRWRQAATMLAAGAATYFHPVSGPPVAFALWAAMASGTNADPIRLRLRNALVSGLAYALVILPYVVRFRSSTVYGQVSFQEWEAALHAIVPEYMNPARSLVEQLMQGHVLVVVGLGAAGLIAARAAERRIVNLLGIFCAALGFAALLVPVLDSVISPRLGRIPQELDFVRAAKYFTPIAVIGLVWGAKLAWQRGGGTAIVWRSRALTIVAGLVCLALNRGTLQTLSQISCSTSSLLALPCQSARDRADITAMYRAIEREVPKRERVFLDNAAQQYFSGGLFSYGVRIYSRRPVAWSWKEGGFLIFTNPAGLVEWYQRWRTLRAIRHLTGEEKSSAFTRLMRQWNVHYVVLDASKPLGPLDVPGRVLHANARAVLMELTPAPLRIIRNASASAGP